MADATPSSGVPVAGDALTKDLGIMIGLLTGTDDADKYILNEDWLADPIGSLSKVPTDKTRRDALVHLLDAIWGKRATESPLLDATGKADENKWLPIPKSKDKPTEASGLYIAPEALADQAEFGLGLMYEYPAAAEETGDDDETGDAPASEQVATPTLAAKVGDDKGEATKFKVKPFAFFPIASLPFPNGNPFVFGHADYPIPVGIEVAFPDKKVTYGGTDYNGFQVIVQFHIEDPTKSTYQIYLDKVGGGYSPLKPDFSDLTTIVNEILAFGQVTTWLDTPFLKGNPNKTGAGKVLTALGLMKKEATSGVYSLGDLATVKGITFEKLVAIALQLLDGLQLLKLGKDGKEGLFIEGVADEAGGKDYGFRFVLTDIVLSGKKEATSGDGEEEAGTSKAGEEAPTPPESAGNQLLLQIGKVFEKDPPEVPPGGGEGGGEGAAAGAEPVPTMLVKEPEHGDLAEVGERAVMTRMGAAQKTSPRTTTTTLLAKPEAGNEGGGGKDESNWTNSEEPLGINLLIVNVSDSDKLTFAPRLDLVSVGIDYKSGGKKPLAAADGFSFTGMEPRAFLSCRPTGTPLFQFGAAMRVDHIELPLDSGLNGSAKSSNPVAANLLGSKGEDGAADGGDKATPPARTQFSFSAGYTPLVKPGSKQHHLNVFLYNSENERTTDTIWWKVEKSFGPVALQKIGISWDNAPRDLGLYLSGGLDMAGLKIELDALSITFPLTDMSKTKLGLKGMSLTYQGGPVEISGAFLETDGPNDTKQYDGEAEIKIGSFGIAAIGSYASVEGHPSLFIFALLDVPLGGPPFFFVTGLAAGFGYNRDLKIPTLDELPKFPLVQGAMAGATGGNPFTGGNDPASAIKVLSKYIPPDYGEDWLAVGVRFTSFEVIQSFALVTVAFGTRFEFALLGLSAVTMPPALPPEDDPIGFAELAMEVTFSPDSGILGVSAKLTPESYILAKACHLTGGFAFYIWGKDNPDNDPKSYHAGDFVITLGGYNSHYKKPAFFPDEPRLGFNWKVSDSFTIKGGMYFALTPSAVMAGGALSAVFQSGPVRAWFEVYADFLLSWKPFYYYIDAGITLGASIKIDILFIHATITIHVGVQLALWGPDFGGKARVDLSIFSFTIHFGSSQPKVQPIDWDDFKASFLPPEKAEEGDGNTPALRALPQVALPHLAAVAKPPKQIATNTICFVRVGSEGLIKDLSKDPNNQSGLDWILDAATAPAAVDIGPSDVAAATLVSHHQISLYRLEEDQHDLAYDFAAVSDQTAIIGNSPQATWNKEAALNPSLQNANDKPLNVAGTLGGFTLQSILKPPDHTLPIDIAHLQYEVAPTEPTFAWSKPGLATKDPNPGKNGTQVLMQTINDPTVSKRREAILANLAGAGLPVDTSVNVADLAKAADQVLLDPPSLVTWVKET